MNRIIAALCYGLYAVGLSRAALALFKWYVHRIAPKEKP